MVFGKMLRRFSPAVLLAAAIAVSTVPSAAADRLWLGNDTEGDVFQTDTIGNILIRIPNANATGIAWDGQFLYFSDHEGNITKRGADGLSVLTGFSIRPSTIDKSTEDMAWDPVRQRLWRVERPNTLRRIDPFARRVDQTYALPSQGADLEAVGVAYDSSRDILYISYSQSEEGTIAEGLVFSANPGTGTLQNLLFRLPGMPAGGLGWDPATDTLWVGTDTDVRNMSRAGALLSRFIRPRPSGDIVDGLEFLSVPAPPTPTSGVSCAITPRNMFLPFHRPEPHMAATNPFGSHVMTVDVTVDGAPGRNVDLTIAATRPVFSAGAAAPPLMTAALRTNTAGRATFSINPPAPVTYDQTDMEIRGSIGARSFTCQASAVTGIGSMSPVLAQFVFNANILPLWRTLDAPQSTASSPQPTSAATAPGLRLLREWERYQPLVTSFLDRRLADTHGSTEDPVRNGVDLAKLPLSFEPNRGQTASEVRYLARGPAHSVYLTPREAIVVNNPAAAIGARSAAVMRMQFVGGNPSAGMIPLDELPGRSHYLIGNDPARWRAGVPQYGRVKYSQVYPGVDLVFYGNQRHAQFDFIVAAGADPNRIRLAFQGVQGLDIDESGDCILRHPAGRMRLAKPILYQEVDGRRRPADGRFVVRENNQVGFEIARYDRTRTLVIDPVLSYASYLGGGNFESGAAIALDRQGNIYVAGSTASANFPTISAFQPALSDSTGRTADVFVMKLNPSGSMLIYSTYVGGADTDVGLGLAVDSTGSAYVTGTTLSANFPVTQAFQRARGGMFSDAFVFKLNPPGSAFIYSTYLGGAGEDSGKGIALDAQTNAYVTGFTASVDFPLLSAVQTTNRGAPASPDAFVTKLNSTGAALVYSTYLGGSSTDLGNAIAVDAAGNAYVAGTTFSSDFPTAFPFQQARQGGADVFVTRINPSGQTLGYSTYFGGEGDDFGTGIAVDGAGNAYLTGSTGSGAFPVRNPLQARPAAGTLLGVDAFVSKLAPNGAALVYSTFLGGRGTDAGMAITVGADGSAYVAGETDSADFPAVGAVQSGLTGSTDAFVARLNPAGSALTLSTTVGGSGLDSAAAVALDASGNAYLTGSSASEDFPATYGAIRTGVSGRVDALLIKIAEGTPPPVITTVSAAGLQARAVVAPDSIVSGFGLNLAPRTEAAPSGAALPTVLAETSVRVRDSAGVDRLAPLFVVSPGQINYLIPSASAAGLASITVERGNQPAAGGTVRVDRVAPALFTANASGRGVASAFALNVAADGAQTSQLIYTCGSAPAGCVASAIPLGGETDRVFLLLFGTGIRGRASPETVKATIAGIDIPVLFAGPQPEFPGLDQVNLGPLPRSLAGRGEVDLALAVEDRRANTVTVRIQ